MADEEKKEEIKEKKSGSNLVIIIIIVLLVLVLAVVGGLAYVMLGDNNNIQQQSIPQQSQPQTQARKPSNVARSSDLTKIGPIYPLDQFIVNLLSEGGTKFLKTKMDIELSSPELTAELDKKKPLIRDIVIRTLSSKTFQEVSTNRGKEKLKDELVDKINAVLADGHVKNIFFTEFVVQ